MKYFLCLIFLATSVAGHFRNDFYRLLAKEHPHENIISSPLALEIALNMVYLGARDKTSDELREALNAPEIKDNVAGKYNAFFKVLKRRESAVFLDIASSFYVNDKFHVVPEFSQLGDAFNSQAVDISLEDTEKAASIVNTWVKEQTHDRIPSAITPKDIDSSLNILLLNTFAFKGTWLFKIQAMKTRKESFQTSSGEVHQVQTMSQYGFYRAADLPELDAKVLQLRYHKSSLSFFAFLPNKADGLSELEDKLEGYIYPNLTSRPVHIKLPKFKIEFTAELSDILKQLKIVDALGADANLQDLVEENNTGISKVIQKGSFEINEDGVGIVPIIGSRDIFVSKNTTLLAPLNFKANHSFAYVIRDENFIYFQGHIVNPE